MARRPRLFAAGVLYHVIVRGNQRQKTFTSDSDYQAYYLERLARYRKKYDYVVARLLTDAQSRSQTVIVTASICKIWPNRN